MTVRHFSRVAAIALCVAASACSGKRLTSDWIPSADAVTLIKSLEKSGDSGAAADRRWVTGIDSRWSDGRALHRVQTEPAPDKPYAWFWCLNVTKEKLASRLEELDAKGFQLVSLSAAKWPDGSERFSGVWRTVQLPKDNGTR